MAIESVIASRINEKLGAMSPTSISIFKVPKVLRIVKKKAYEPQIVSIGPYHRGKNHLKAMEVRKMECLRMLLKRKGENNMVVYVSAMKKLEEKTRACYEDSVRLNSEEFVEMMLLDACFIVELLRKYTFLTYDSYDDRPKWDWMMTATFRDLLLLENQLPFSVLQKFFDITTDDPRNECLYDMFIELFHRRAPLKSGHIIKNIRNIRNVNHVLGLLHESWIPLHISQDKNFKFKCNWFECYSGVGSKTETKEEPSFVRCATELREAGIKFRKSESKSMFDIRFENGKVKIPPLKIDNNSECFFRNLIVYEQLCQDKYHIVTDYVRFMDCLVNTSKDVELLCQNGIIHNRLGDDKSLANMFNRLCENAIISDQSLYSKLYTDVNGHCRKYCKKSIAILRHNYFNSPWALISLLAAVFLLLLTTTQTVFSVLSYVYQIKHKS